ncbi:MULTISPECIES: hypothetical protein [unclassified Pseudomonas]|uniref:hypothetical protein n=1 Tax=unclassified Pseudomonas TaxID=196821 RepID=UPI0011EDDB0F|nr:MULTISPECIES: hypothetical protein [unclassified Pseudomonas]KAA0946961.1 hypothetical protein FQ182_11450 [Pseudomonas sp. ANT_H4]KAA0953502.1 hypothetical protein FQ186_05675 [Pseudomonas sp. ANT_H14]
MKFHYFSKRGDGKNVGHFQGGGGSGQGRMLKGKSGTSGFLSFLSALIHIKGLPRKIRYNKAGADHAPVIGLMTS